ncbi:MAG: ABC transporter ATP-binding protein [Alphaproteobacteria bacterium]
MIMRQDPLLILEGVHTHIGRYHILQGIDLQIPEGEVTMLLGRNGAGKTTTLRTIMGLWRASQGKINFAGQAIETWPTPEIAQSNIAYIPETMAVFADLTVKENMILAVRKGLLDEARLNWIFGFFPALRKFWLFPAGSLSGGQKQMLSIARAMAEPRRLILVDEPSKGLAPSIVEALIAAFQELKRAKTTLLMVEQNFRLAQAVGTHVAVMDDGRIIHHGTMAVLAADQDLQRRLLGLNLDHRS